MIGEVFLYVVIRGVPRFMWIPGIYHHEKFLLVMLLNPFLSRPYRGSSRVVFLVAPVLSYAPPLQPWPLTSYPDKVIKSPIVAVAVSDVEGSVHYAYGCITPLCNQQLGQGNTIGRKGTHAK